MNDYTKNGGPAFPTDSEDQISNTRWHFEGMSLRDYFAASALNGLLSLPDNGLVGCEEHALFAYMHADAMLKEREK